MIYLTNHIDSAFDIDNDLVADYKITCDQYLVNVRRNLTRQLVFYKVYNYLQKVNNTYFVIIDKLMNNQYESLEQLKKDYSEFEKECNSFIKNCETVIPENIINRVKKDIDKLRLAMNKLLYIAENICLKSEDYYR